jgi:hypothetical protein
MTANSKIKVNSLEAYDPIGPVLVSYGASVPAGQTLTLQGNVNITGIVTASSFVGNGSGLTGLRIATQSNVIAYKKIFSYDECYRS